MSAYRSARFKWLLTLFIVASLPAFASNHSPVYRCTVNGQTVLTDKPCDSPATTAVPGAVAAAANNSPNNPISGAQTIVGDWSGQTQFQGAQNGQIMDEAHSVVPLVLTFSADGKVSSSSADNGCALLGLWAPGATPRLFMLDITLKGCRYSGLNRRYSGTLIATFSDDSAQFSLMTYAPPIPGQPIRKYDLGATLRR
jgi:hypothetical protein